MTYSDQSGFPPGEKIAARFKIKKKLGRGGVARVYLAEDTHNISKLCVVKEFVLAPQNQDYLSSQDLKQILNLSHQRERDALKKIGKPDLIETFEDKSTKYIVEEYIKGKTLSEYLSSGELYRFFSYRESRKIKDLLVIWLEKLKEIHDNNIIHRDIQPDNIILQDDDINNPVFIDFGSCKEISIIKKSKNLEQNAVSKVVARSDYIAPERLPDYKFSQDLNHSEQHNHARIDIYSLGIIFKQLITELSQNKELKASLDKLKDILEKMIKNDHRKRYQSVDEILKDIRSLRFSEPPKKKKIGELLILSSQQMLFCG